MQVAYPGRNAECDDMTHKYENEAICRIQVHWSPLFQIGYRKEKKQFRYHLLESFFVAFSSVFCALIYTFYANEEKHFSLR